MRLTAPLRLATNLGRLGISIAASGASLVALGAHASGAPISGRLLFGAFACIYFVYNLDHIVGGEKEDAGLPGRVAFLRRFRRPLWVATLAVPLAHVALALWLQPSSLLYGLPCVVGVFLYALPTLPFGRYRCIKDIPLAKNVYVPALWTTLLLFAEPWRSSAPTWASGTVLASLFVFARIFVGVMGNDLRDADGDAAAGLTTATHVLGRTAVIRISDGINLVSAALVAALAHLRSEPLLCLVWAALLLASWMARAMARAGTAEERELLGELWDIEYLAVGAVVGLVELVGGSG